MTNDDMIVHGSVAIGFDAVNGESFGFDTLRLKENNLRIHFQDTSSTASFPTNDWRIVINDSTNGGNSYFEIQDATGGQQSFRIEAGAPSFSMFIEESSGDVGLGTNNPATELHMSSGDTPTVRLGQSGVSGWTPQVWDVAANETNFFIRDVTNGSELPLRIKTGAPSNSLYVDVDGDIGLGTNAPSVRLHVEGAAFISQTLEIGSSRERKEAIRELSLDEARSALEGLQPVEFRYKEDPESQLGFIAEDVPDIVATADRKSVRPMDFVAVLAKVMQEHERRELELVETIDGQQREIERLAQRLSALEDETAPEPVAKRQGAE